MALARYAGAGDSKILYIAIALVAVIAIAYMVYTGIITIPGAVAPPAPTETMPARITAAVDVYMKFKNAFAEEGKLSLPSAIYVLLADPNQQPIIAQTIDPGKYPTLMATMQADVDTDNPVFTMYVAVNNTDPSFYLIWPAGVDTETNVPIGTTMAHPVLVKLTPDEVHEGKGKVELEFRFMPMAQVTLGLHPNMTIGTTSLPVDLYVTNALNVTEYSMLKNFTIVITTNSSNLVPVDVEIDGTKIPLTNSTATQFVANVGDITFYNETTITVQVHFKAYQKGTYTVTYEYKAVDGVGAEQSLGTATAYISVQ